MCEGEISPDARETEIGGLPARYSCDQSNFTKPQNIEPSTRPSTKSGFDRIHARDSTAHY